MTQEDDRTVPALGDWLAFVDGEHGVDLVVTDRGHPQARRLLKPRRLSPSTASALEGGCHARWAVERSLPRSADPFGAAELGSSAHAVMEELMQLPAGERTPEAINDLVGRIETVHTDLAVPTDAMQLSKWRGAVFAKMSRVYDTFAVNEVQTFGTEVHLDDVQVAGVPVNGFVDLITLEPDGLCVRDYKTGKAREPYPGERDDYADQQRIYVMGLAAKLKQLPAAAMLHYTAEGVTKSVDLSPEAMRGTAAMFSASWDRMNANAATGRFSMKPSGLCGWCPLATICPTGNAKRKVVPKSVAAQEGSRLSIPRLLKSRAGDGGRRTVPVDSPTEQGRITMIAEGKVWEETLPAGQVNPVTSSPLNPNSFAAISAMTFTTEAYKILATHAKNGGARLGGEATVRSLALCLSSITLAAQNQLGLRTSLQDGSNTRMRAAMYAALEIAPPPLEASDAAVWTGWMNHMVARIVMLFRVSTQVWDAGQVATPFADLTAAIAAGGSANVAA